MSPGDLHQETQPPPLLFLLIINNIKHNTAVVSGGSLQPLKALWAFSVGLPVYVKTIPENVIARAQKLFTKLIPYNE